MHTIIVPLIYEGLHKVCALCGSELEACPKYPVQAKFEVVVEKFEQHSISNPAISSESLKPSTAWYPSTFSGLSVAHSDSKKKNQDNY